MKQSEPPNPFELEMLEERILLSADSLLGGLPGAAPDNFGPLLDVTPLLPPLEEVLLSDDDCQQENCSLQYDPAQGLDDIFSGLTGEDYSDDMEEDSSEPLPYEDSAIFPTQKEELTLGLQEFARLGTVLEDLGEFGMVLPLTEDSSMGGLLGLSEILDSRLCKPVYDYFSDAVDPPSTEGVLAALQESSGSYGDLQIRLDSLEGGVVVADSEIRFEVKATATRTGEVRLEVEVESGPEVGLEARTATTFVATLELDYTFGISRNPKLEGRNLSMIVSPKQS